MKSILSKTFSFCICLGFILSAPAVKAQAIYQPEQRETITATSPDGSQTVTVVLPRRAIQSTELALIVNIQDPQSVNVAAHYQQVRNIPAANVIQVTFRPG